MKVIKYKVCTCVNNGTDAEPDIERVFHPMEIECATQAVFDANYPIAEKEAVPGTIDVSGEFEPEPVVEPTQLDRVEAQVTYTAMMTDTLLEV